ncbi:receptor-like protein 12 [Durio zibethinus]|uniref:Receptor-like protein 12 n=1 Tax=Durio zibethinus TaxID=66656 RepID=A0A6P5WP38_DURZI|nr:receptor-like protein 12 [Durio zibethinus]
MSFMALNFDPLGKDNWNFAKVFNVDCLRSSTHLCLPEQKAALLEFKNTISLSDYCVQFISPRTNSWNETTDCCSWEGVSCNQLTGHVIAVNLSGSCLYGSLPANTSLFQLQGLQRLDLSDNNFNGSIPSELFRQLVSLTHLNLYHSGFSDLIPHEICLLSNLDSLDLSSYSSPASLRFDAEGFDMLARNLTKLRDLALQYVDMSGVAVTSFLNLSSSLERLSLGYCQLHGQFPSEVFRLPYLQHVDLGWNQNLTGFLPKTNLSLALELMDLSFCRFSGSIPASFGNLTQITFLDFSENDFGGQIPDAFENLNKLTTLKFSSCNFSGQVPLTMFKLTQITHLDLSHNRVEGALPNHVDQLQLLEELSLSNNLIGGGVPSWLFTLPSLLNLDLSYNKLTGQIEEIQMPNCVQSIDLSSNDIHGPIPSSFFDLVNLSTLHLSSNNLSGVIESNMLFKLENLYTLDLSNNSLLSLITSGNDVNYSSRQLVRVLFSSCSIRQFPSFFRTSRLEVLDLSNNKISGGVSKWDAEGWVELNMLNLSYNFLTSLEQFPGKYLQILDLHSNMLQGPILSTCLNLQMPNPPLFLSIFLISENKLTGNIPSLICNWTSLVVLDLSKNSLSGTIPECLGNASSALQFLNLQMNNFYGKIPDSFMNNMLRNLLLNDNQLEGSLPRSLANCSSLEVLNLGNNKLTDTFPHWLASLPRLQVLILRLNRLHGSLPNSIASSNFSTLRIIDLSGNELTGPLPTNLFQNLRAMKDVPKLPLSEAYLFKTDARTRYVYEYYQSSVNVTTKRLEIELVKTLAIFVAMDFSNNLFGGQIPEELGELISLQMLNFSHNSFTGPIPPSLGNMVALESLDLSSNKLGGTIPSQLTNLTFLAVLNLSENNLVGPIPHGNQLDTFDNDSYSGNLGLCGLPLSKQCNNREGPKPPAPMFEEHEGFSIPFIWKVAMMGYGSGVVLGLSMGYIVFTTGRPWWIVRKIERDWQKKVSFWIHGRRRN